MTTVRGSRAQPQSLAQRLSKASITGRHDAAHSESETEDQDRTPRAQHQTIGVKSSSETLRAKKLANASNASTPNTTASNTLSTVSSSTAVSNSKPKAEKKSSSKNAYMTDSSISSRFSLSSKKKKQQREEQRREEQRIKEAANEAFRKKHGEYHPPGHSQGQVHTHRVHPHHDHHQLERSRSSSNVRSQYRQQRQRSQSSTRVASVAPMTSMSPSSPASPSPSPTPSSAASSVYSSYRSGSSWGSSRPTSPTFGMTAISMDQQISRAQMDDLNDLEAESIPSEHWDSNSESENDEDIDRKDHNRRRGADSNGYSRGKEHQRNTSVDTSSSFRTNNSSMVHFDLRPLSPCSVASSRPSQIRRYADRSTLSVDMHNHPAITQQIESDHPDDVDLEMREVGRPGRHRSWQQNNKSTTGIVTGLSPEFDGPPRPHTSMSRYHSRSKSRDNMAERYLYDSRPHSPDPSSTSNHRPHSRHRHHHSYNISHYGNDLSDLDPSALEALRFKAGSRAAGTIHGDTTIAGSVEASTFGTEHPTDEHNYLAPLPPFQQGPAYTKVPKRKYCKWFFGGCRWWVLLLIFLVLAGIAAAAAGGTINIVDSPNATETRVLLKLQRQFYNMASQMDVTGFQIDSFQNGTVQYVLNDKADSNRGFFKPTVLCSNSILTIEMPRASLNRSELSLDVQVNKQDISVNLDESVRRNSNWVFRGTSNQNVVIQSLNVNALSISYTSTSPSTITLGSVIVRDRLSVMSLSGDIQAAVGLTSQVSSSSTPATINLNTFDGYVQFDMRAWNQTCSFQAISPSVQVSKSEYVVLPFGYHGSTGVNMNGLVANSSSNGVSGSFVPGSIGGTPASKLPTTSTIATSTKTGTTSYSTVTTKTTTSTSSSTATVTSTISSTAVSHTPTTSATLPGPTLGAGGSSMSAQIVIQANKYAILNFP
ncbi:hypothetical protein BGX21_006934 [Mortierella sp. AD011]|nr:hypothetical protein BGX21_006934 [Mortierella sp. AD011]